MSLDGWTDARVAQHRTRSMDLQVRALLSTGDCTHNGTDFPIGRPAMLRDGQPASDNPEWVVRTVLFVDLVESVRLMEADESDAVQRWRQIVATVQRDVLPAHTGRLVKSMGDGLMLEFPSVQPAIRTAFAIQHACAQANAGVPPDRQMLLRMGAHVGQLIADEHDIYGRGVNLAARLTTLAGPGEIVVSADVRDQLIPVLDADIEDLGACYVKHVNEPVRAYRVGPPGPRPVIEPGSAAMPELRPTVAVIPFAARGGETAHQVLGEVLADEIISALSRTADLNVISRLSTTVFRGRDASLGEVGGYLNATYVLSGAYLASGNQLNLSAELADAKSGNVVWAKSLKGQVTGIVSGKDGLIDKAVAGVSSAIMARELVRAQSQPLPTLESYTLLMGAIALMHRLSLRDFDRAKQMLQTLTERAPRQAIPWAWTAKWHVLRVQQGWSDNPDLDARLALDCTKRALDADAQCSLALAVDGFVHTNLLKQLDVALDRYERALRVNPNDSLALLLKGTLHAFKGEGKLALKDTKHALRLSPLDPLRYFYDSLAATAALSAGDYERALELARRSLRANRTHTSTLRALLISQWQLGKTAEARSTVAELLRLDPTFTMTKWAQRSPAAGYEIGKLWFDVLQKAGVPA
jgi:class 3 adenylate cyclase/TolB-like protein/Tfp pilus assembly protein PilF